MELNNAQKAWLRSYEEARQKGGQYNQADSEWVDFADIPLPDWFRIYSKKNEPKEESVELPLEPPLEDIEDGEWKTLFREAGRQGGKIGGVKRAEVLSPDRRSEIARLGGIAKAKRYERED